MLVIEQLLSNIQRDQTKAVLRILLQVSGNSYEYHFMENEYQYQSNPKTQPQDLPFGLVLGSLACASGW